jgi:hypothetical protein
MLAEVLVTSSPQLIIGIQIKHSKVGGDGVLTNKSPSNKMFLIPPHLRYYFFFATENLFKLRTFVLEKPDI